MDFTTSIVGGFAEPWLLAGPAGSIVAEKPGETRTEGSRTAIISRSMIISVAFPKVHGCVEWPQPGRLVRSTRTIERYLFRRSIYSFFFPSILFQRSIKQSSSPFYSHSFSISSPSYSSQKILRACVQRSSNWIIDFAPIVYRRCDEVHANRVLFRNVNRRGR